MKNALVIAALGAGMTATAQESTDTIPGMLDQVKSEVGMLKKLKISGYVQVQGQWLETQDDKSYKVPSAAGGDFAAYQDTRLGVRRGRLKFAYSSSPLSQAVVQLDATEKGLALKDAYIKATEPFAKALTLTAGVFDRPFGFEIGYSSSSREMPERSRMMQNLFPGERDLGAMVTLQAPKTSRLNFVKLDVAAISGHGVNQDIDRYKDIVGRLGMSKTFFDEKLKVGGGASYYWGGLANQTKTVYTTGTDTTGALLFVADIKDENLYARSLKELVGIDLQVSVDAPWGLATLRGEYIQGQQPTMADKTVYPTTLSDNYSTTATTVDDKTTYSTKLVKKLGDTYIRKVNGYYFYLVQNIMQTRHQLVIKYDVYDPNTDVEGGHIDGKRFFWSDMMYSTIGLGYIFKIDANTKLMVHGDIVKNESTKIGASSDKATGKVTDPGWEGDRKDNVLTVRLQYKF